MSDTSHSFCRTCHDLADIVCGSPSFKNGVCIIELERDDLCPTILGVPTRSPMVLEVSFSIEAPDKHGETLNVSEAVLREEEVNTVMLVLRERHIKVTAVHNHWLFEHPRLIYLHSEAIMDPECFLKAHRDALHAAGVKTRPADDDDET